MKRKLLFVPLLAMALAGCNTNDDVTVVPPTDSEGLVGVNTVSFSNNTSLTIGNDQNISRSVMSRAAMNVNAAAGLKMEESLASYLESKGLSLDASNVFTVKGALDEDTYKLYYEETGMRYIYVPSGVDFTLDFNLNHDSGNGGELALTILVDEGAKMVFKVANEDATLKGIEILSWGTLDLPEKVNVTNSIVKVAGACSVGNEGTIKLTEASLYIGGDLTGAILANKAVIYIGGTMNYETTSYRSCELAESSMYVAGALDIQNLSLSEGSDFDTNCKLTVSNELQVNASELSASSCEAKKGIFVDAVTWLPANGAAVFETMQIQSTNAFHIYGEGSALISCYEVKVLNKNAIENLTFDSDYYLNSKTTSFMLDDLKGETPSFEGKVNWNVDGVGITGVDDECNIGVEVPGVDVPGGDESGDDESGDVGTGDKVVLTIPTDIEEEWFLKADDFAIRVDGVYQNDIVVENNVTSLENIKITENDLTVTVSGIESLEKFHDYTYEVWLWVSEDTWLNTFTESDRAAWVSGDGHGTDVTEESTTTEPEGYTVRKNVYKGLSGHADTPYIKVSIHITKDE